MDEILENEIKFNEELIKQYQRLSELSGISTKRQSETIDRILDTLSELYKRRRQNKKE